MVKNEICGLNCWFVYICIDLMENNCRLPSVVVKNFFRSRDQDRQLDKMNSSLESMVSKSHHWLHQFQLVTEHSLKGGTNYGNHATGVGTKHAVLRPRPSPGSSGLETETSTKWTRVHSNLEIMVSRSQHWDYLVYKDSLTCIFFRRPSLVPKGTPILRDVEFAITCKKVVTRLT